MMEEIECSLNCESLTSCMVNVITLNDTFRYYTNKQELRIHKTNFLNV